MSRARWFGIAAITGAVALASAFTWHRISESCPPPSLNLELRANGEEPWLWRRAPARYRVNVTGSDLAADVLWDTAHEHPMSRSKRLKARYHEKGVVSFVLESPPPHFKITLELDGAIIFERELAVRTPKPCRRESIYIELSAAVADRVNGPAR